jgi:uncharacterized SAM-binding protein YcdF (DUF218 family)
VFVIKKILAGFFIPPGLFVTLLAGSVVYLLIRKTGKKVWIYLGAVALAVWALSIAPVADALTRSLEKAVPVPREVQGDVVIVLYGTGQRLAPALSYRASLKVPLILCGFNYLDRSSGDRAGLLESLEETGVPPGDVIFETRSRDTQENIRAAKAICEERRFRRPVVVTSAFHSRRVRLTCRKLDFPATVVPVAYSVLGRAIHYTWRDYLPLAEDLYATSLSLNEYLGLVFYKIFY